MRRARLLEVVTELIGTTWTSDDEDIANAVLTDADAFGALCHHLNEAGGGDADGITQAWHALVDSLSDDDLDWLADEAINPAAFLASRVR